MSKHLSYTARLTLALVFLLGALFVTPQSAQAQENATTEQ